MQYVKRTIPEHRSLLSGDLPCASKRCRREWNCVNDTRLCVHRERIKHCLLLANQQ